MDRLDFVIYGLNLDKVKANQTVLRNIFDLEEPRFHGDILFKSFNRKKILTAETVSSGLEELIQKYK